MMVPGNAFCLFRQKSCKFFRGVHNGVLLLVRESKIDEMVLKEMG